MMRPSIRHWHWDTQMFVVWQVMVFRLGIKAEYWPVRGNKHAAPLSRSRFSPKFGSALPLLNPSSRSRERKKNSGTWWGDEKQSNSRSMVAQASTDPTVVSLFPFTLYLAGSWPWRLAVSCCSPDRSRRGGARQLNNYVLRWGRRSAVSHWSVVAVMGLIPCSDGRQQWLSPGGNLEHSIHPPTRRRCWPHRLPRRTWAKDTHCLPVVLRHSWRQQGCAAERLITGLCATATPMASRRSSSCTYLRWRRKRQHA